MSHSMHRWLRFLIFTTFLFKSAFLVAQSQVTQRLLIPYGDSVWRVNLSEPLRTSSVQVNYQLTASCPGLFASVQFWDDTFGQWRVAPFQSGVFLFENRLVRNLEVRWTQNYVTQADCQVYLLFQQDLPSPDPSGKLTFAGVYNYRGGVAQITEFVLDPPYFARSIVFELPSFCTGVEVIEFGIVKQGQKIPAKQESGSLWYLTQPQAFNQLYFTLKGPVGRSCQIPIYIYDLAV